ncbi:MAG: IS30 family transposase [Leptospira sp.]|nr:IS30 family transposase [Leptospira sp.]
MVHYSRIKLEEREIIAELRYNENSIRSIAKKLNRSPSTISRELTKGYSRNSIIKYSALNSQIISQKNESSRNYGKIKLKKHPTLKKFINSKLELKWSPEQIEMSLKENPPTGITESVSHQTIYTYIYLLPRGELKKELQSYLRRKMKPYKKSKNTDNRGKIPEMISIEERPKSVEKRSIPGHWEGDLIIGKNHKSAIGTIVERTTRNVILVPLTSTDAETVRKSFAKELKKLPKELRISMTYDRGKEMSNHKLFTKDTKMKVYFCHPGSPWERGTCENTNMLIRDFFPKKTDFNKISRKELKRVQKLLNERPRKSLGWKTPAEKIKEVLR